MISLADSLAGSVRAVPSPQLQHACPCGTGATYDACCGRLHRGAAQAATALELVRSRYSAFALDEIDHLFRTWHPRTRPDELSPDTSRRWTGLDILDVVDGGPDDDTGIVEFVAHYDQHGLSDLPGEQRERSRFTRRGGRWVYLDAVEDPGTPDS